MPTYEDVPWERDARKRAQDARRRPPRRGRTVLLLVVLVAAVMAVIGLGTELVDGRAEPARGAAGEAKSPPVRAPAIFKGGQVRSGKRRRPRSATPKPVYRLRNLQSRFTSPGILEVWGNTSAPDGTTIQLRVSSGGVRRRLANVPAARGRFYARQQLPASLRGRSVRILARIAR